jgi:hypothetical protein
VHSDGEVECRIPSLSGAKGPRLDMHDLTAMQVYTSVQGEKRARLLVALAVASRLSPSERT